MLIFQFFRLQVKSMKMIGKRKKEKKGTYSSNKSEKKTDRKCIAEEKNGACEKMITE